MIVMKFGGTSVGNADRIRNSAGIVKSFIKKNPVVVVSAVAKITDALIRLANECANGKGSGALEDIKKMHHEILEQLKIEKSLLDEDFRELSELSDKTKSEKYLDDKALDCFQSFGERMSSKIFAGQLAKTGLKSKSFNSWELGLLTDSEFGNAEPLESAYANIKNSIRKFEGMPVITGFIGKNENGEITTLGRGGSDYTAAIVGAAVNADEIQIWTDVNGVMTADPRVVSSAKTIEIVSFAEASELAYFGAKVLHPKTILPAMRKNIPVKVLNSFNPKYRGTTIINKSQKYRHTIKAITYKKNITLINIDSTRMLGAYGFLARLFDIFDEYKKSVDVVSTSEVSVTLTIDNDEKIGNIVSELKEIAEVEVKKGKSIICIIGEGLRNTPGIAGKTFTALGKYKINVEMISQGASEINLTFIIDGKYAEKAVKILHKVYFGG